ncbi:MAG TPA: hypothetical protein VI756_14350, partial [Blastocatellia bacterium]
VYILCRKPDAYKVWPAAASAAASCEGSRPHYLREESIMRMLLQVSIPVEAGNAAAKAGTLGSTVERIVAGLQPEAAYFMADDNGNRSGFVVFDLKDTSQIPAVAEPWFLAFNARVSLRPVMTPQDLAAGAAGITKAVADYGDRT